MGNKLEFPGNTEMYLKQVKEHINNNRLEEAHVIIKKVYAYDQSATITYLYTLVLSGLGKGQEALDVANAQKDSFLEIEEHRVHYATLLTQNQLFLEAEVLIQQHLSDPTSPHYASWLEAEMILDLLREAFNMEAEMQKNYAKEELKNIESYPPMKQAEIVKNGRDLELRELQEMAPFILTNPHVFGNTRSAFLEVLIEKRDSNEYIIPWFNQQKPIVPSKTPLFNQEPIVQEIDGLLTKKLHKHPSLFEVIKNELIDDLLKLYPFIEDVVTDLNYWVDCYIDLFDYSNKLEIDITPKTNEQEVIKNWVDGLTKLRLRREPGNN